MSQATVPGREIGDLRLPTVEDPLNVEEQDALFARMPERPFAIDPETWQLIRRLPATVLHSRRVLASANELVAAELLLPERLQIQGVTFLEIPE
jgi:hypothetical protein